MVGKPSGSPKWPKATVSARMNLRLPIAKHCLSNVEVLLTIQVLRRGRRLRSPRAVHSFTGYANTEPVLRKLS